jgi:hypothetical protein
MKAQTAFPIEINIPPLTVTSSSIAILKNPEMNAVFPSQT